MIHSCAMMSPVDELIDLKCFQAFTVLAHHQESQVIHTKAGNYYQKWQAILPQKSE
jgi:hypothetical protein